jgi:hypothetical protein
VVQVVAAVLADAIPHLGRIYELTGPQSQDIGCGRPRILCGAEPRGHILGH